MTRLLLALLYPVVILGRVLNLLLGRDPLRRSAAPKSFWIERKAPADASYFDESSSIEEKANTGMGAMAAAVLALAARFYVPPRARAGEKFSAAADREQGIPDEMYTLW